MQRRTVIGAIAGVSLAALAASTANRNEERAPTTDTEQPTEVQPGSDSTVTAATEPDAAFELELDELVECGATCREVTAEITNTGEVDATGVHVTVTLETGDEHLWETEEAVGTLEAGDSITRTERVDLGFGGALSVRGNDDRVTITMTIESDQRTEEFVREQVIDT